MTSYKDPSFQDRVGRAAEAKKKALEQLRSKPPVDPAVLEERKAASLKREAAKAQKAAEKEAAAAAAAEATAALEAAEAEAKAQAAAAAAEAEAAVPPPRTEAERKADRDARYAARKKRK